MYLWMVSLSLSRYQSVENNSRSDLDKIHSLWPRWTGIVGTKRPGHVTVLIACSRTPRRTERHTTHRDFRVVIQGQIQHTITVITLLSSFVQHPKLGMTRTRSQDA